MRGSPHQDREGEEGDATGGMIKEDEIPDNGSDATGGMIKEDEIHDNGSDAAGGMIKEDEIPDNGSEEEEGKQFEVEAYAAMYSGRNKISRLLFVAGYCGIRSVQLRALKIAYEEIKKGEDTQLFRKVVEEIGGRLGEEYGPDDEWADSVDKRAAKLESELMNQVMMYKGLKVKRRDLSRESLRPCYTDLGHLYYKRGQLVEAFRNYEYARAYSIPSLQLERFLDVISVAMELGMYTLVPLYVSYAEQSPAYAGLGDFLKAKLRGVAALAYLETREYMLAAYKFIKTRPIIEMYIPNMIIPRDIAVYGGLCALASFDVVEFQNNIIDNRNFQKILEYVPDMRKLIDYFKFGEISSFFEHLGSLKDRLLLDIHLRDHVDDLYAQIRMKALIRYIYPFCSLHLHEMANDCLTSVKDLVTELEWLVEDGQIQVDIYPQEDLLVKVE